MPLGSSRFYFKNKDAGTSSGVATRYPTLPTLPNTTIFYSFLDNFTSLGAPTNNTAYLGNVLPCNVAYDTGTPTIEPKQNTMITVPNGQVYITANWTTNDNSAWNYFVAYDPTTHAFTQHSVRVDFGVAQTINLPNSAHYNADGDRAWYLRDNSAVFTTLTYPPALVGNGNTKFFNRYANGTIINTTFDSSLYLQNTSNVLLGMSDGGDTTTVCYEFNVDSGNVQNYYSKRTTLRTGSNDSDGLGLPWIQHPTTGNVYCITDTGTNIGSNMLQDWDSVNNIVREYIPANASTVFANNPSGQYPFGTVCLGVDQNLYWLPKGSGNIMIHNPVANTAIVISESTVGFGGSLSGNAYVSSVLGPDGNIYAPLFGGYTGVANTHVLHSRHWLSIDTKPDSPTYQQHTYISMGDDSTNYRAYTQCAVAGDGNIIAYGPAYGSANVQVRTNTVSILDVNGTGYIQVSANPYLNKCT